MHFAIVTYIRNSIRYREKIATPMELGKLLMMLANQNNTTDIFVQKDI